MSELLQSPILIVGIGDDLSPDNAAGLLVARKIQRSLGSSPNVTILEMSGEGHALSAAWKKANTLILIDAVSLGDVPGTLYCFDAHKQELPANRFYHPDCEFSFTDAIALARMLKQLPSTTIIYGIERSQQTQDMGVSVQVEQTAEVLAALLRDWAQVYTPYAFA